MGNFQLYEFSYMGNGNFLYQSTNLESNIILKHTKGRHRMNGVYKDL